MMSGTYPAEAGRTPNMPGHGNVVDRGTGQLLSTYHIERVVERTNDEVWWTNIGHSRESRNPEGPRTRVKLGVTSEE
jgi:hypothetical protein